MIAAALALAVSAPSFDCAKASATVEKMICSDERLARADQAVSLLYRSIPKKAARAAREQREWLADRDRCKNSGCLLDAYEARIWNLLAQSDLDREYMRGLDGTLSVLPLGNSWYAFSAYGEWVGSVERGEMHTADAVGVFKLVNGRASRAPVSQDDCGWKIQQLLHGRWKLENWPGSQDFACGGWNATVEGVYR
jgi:uncharacterized protein